MLKRITDNIEKLLLQLKLICYKKNTIIYNTCSTSILPKKMYTNIKIKLIILRSVYFRF